MKRMNKLYALSFSLLLTGAVCAADMGTPTSGLPSREDHATQSWTVDGQTALIRAASRDHKEIVGKLIAAGADVDAQDKYGWSALMWSAYRGHAEIVEKLLVADAQVNAQDNNGVTALMWAVQWGHIEIVQVLLAARALSTITDSDEKTALAYAQEKGNTAIVALLQNHVDIEPEDETLMIKPAVD